MSCKLNIQAVKAPDDYDYRTNIVKYASTSPPAIVPFSVLDSLCTKYFPETHNCSPIYYEDNIFFSSIFILACDSWTEDITDGCSVLPADMIIAAAISVLDYIRIGPSYKFEEPGRFPLSWNVTLKEENSQAKLLFQSLLHFSVFETKGMATYYGSGCGDTYATDVLQSYLSKQGRDYQFIDPQSPHIPAAPTQFSDNALFDVYDEHSISVALEHSKGMTIKSTSIGAGTSYYHYYAGKKEKWFPVHKPFHMEGMYLTARNFFKYVIGMLEDKNQYNCGCISCRGLQFLSHYHDFGWLYGSFNTPDGHRLHMWKLPGLTKFETLSDRFGMTKYVAPVTKQADTDYENVKSYFVGKVVNFGSGSTEYKDVINFDDNLKFPPPGDTIYARMSLHHDPSMFFFVAKRYPIIVIQDEIRSAPGRYWNHTAHHYGHEFVSQHFETRGYEVKYSRIIGDRYTLVLHRSRDDKKRLRGKRKDAKESPGLPIYVADLPEYLQPVFFRYGSRVIDGYDFKFDGKHYLKSGSVQLKRYATNNNFVNFSVDLEKSKDPI